MYKNNCIADFFIIYDKTAPGGRWSCIISTLHGYYSENLVLPLRTTPIRLNSSGIVIIFAPAPQ